MFNKDFYPTPESLIAKMFIKIEKDQTMNILEPSAGKGNIVDYFQDKIKYSKKNWKIDCIEIEEELQSILKNKGYKLAVASSTSSDSVFHHLNEKNITAYFDKVICGDMIKNSKPAPDIYLKACEELGENPTNCIAIEDSKNGILSAKNADMNVIMIPDLWQGDDDTDKLLFAKLKSLGEINIVL